MNLEEQENYDQDDQNFRVNEQILETDIDAPPFDNSFSDEDQDPNQQNNSKPYSLSNDENYNTAEQDDDELDDLDDEDLDDEDIDNEDIDNEDIDDEDPDNEDSSEERRNDRFRNNEQSNNNFQGL